MKTKHTYLLLFLAFVTNNLLANDSIMIRSHNRTHLNWYGTFKHKTFFPPNSDSTAKTMMRFTLGCPDKGCSEWDYTVKISLIHKDGSKDSITKSKKNHWINGAAIDSAKLTRDTVYDLFNSNGNAYKQARTPVLIQIFNNPNKPDIASDTLYLWQQAWGHHFDTLGQKVDSVFFAADTTVYSSFLQWKEYFNKTERFEMARLITPYANGFGKTWTFPYWFDVTDYAILLNDTVEIEVEYQGYQDGFTAGIDFYYVPTGHAVQKVHKIVNVYTGWFPYGYANDPIESRLVAKKYPVKSIAENHGLVYKVIQTGHGFGGNENCAEFCAKKHYIKINGQQQYEQNVWRDNCGLNPIYPQPGTWLYDRANWCPGSAVTPYYYNISPFVAATDSFVIDMDMDAFVNSGNNNCGYIISGQLMYYKNYDAAPDLEIIAPNNATPYNRYNPTCDNAIVRITNNSLSPINHIRFEYGIEGNAPQVWDWGGTIEPYKTVEIKLPSVNWLGNASSSKFFATTKLINWKNNTPMAPKAISVFNSTPHYPSQIVVQMRTNNYPEDNIWTLTDLNGNTIKSKQGIAANTVYRDTLFLSPGCYRFLLTDANKNGLNFWAFPAGGTGSILLRDHANNATLKSFNADFGTQIEHFFTVGYAMTETNHPTYAEQIDIYPNPATNNFIIESYTAIIQQIKLIDISGRVIQTIATASKQVYVDTGLLPKGLYFVEIITDDGNTCYKKVIIQ